MINPSDGMLRAPPPREVSVWDVRQSALPAPKSNRQQLWSIGVHPFRGTIPSDLKVIVHKFVRIRSLAPRLSSTVISYVRQQRAPPSRQASDFDMLMIKNSLISIDSHTRGADSAHAKQVVWCQTRPQPLIILFRSTQRAKSYYGVTVII